MTDIIRPGIALFIISCIAAALLGTVNAVTKGPIEQNALKAKEAALSRVVSGLAPGGSFGDEIKADKNGVVSYYEYYEGSEPAAYVINVKEKGFGGDMEILVGVYGDGIISGIDILSHGETPGLGANADSDKFKAQFIGMSGTLTVSKSPKNDNEIEAISSATITSDAVTRAVNNALSFYNNEIKQARTSRQGGGLILSGETADGRLDYTAKGGAA